MAVTSGTPLCFVKLFHLNKIGGFMLGNNHLGYTFAIIYDKVCIGEVHQQNLHFSPVVCIYRACRL